MVDQRKRTISFNEELHTYTDEYNKRYTSVTTLIGQYHEQFNEDFWAKKKAQESGLTVEQVKANWKQIRDNSCVKGSKEHKLIEDSVNNSKVTILPNRLSLFPKGMVKLDTKLDIQLLASSPLALKYPEILYKLMEFIDAGYSIYVEKRVYWADFLIAGTIDCLLVKGNRFWILDWKTNKDELKFKSGYYKKIGGIKTSTWVDKKEYFFQPINNLEFCKGNVYSLQLSLYAYLMELWGLVCEGLILYHIRDVVDQQSEQKHTKVMAYNIPYLRSACEILTIDFKNASNGSKNRKINNNNSPSFGLF